MAHHGRRFHAQRDPPARQRVLDGEKCGLREPGLIQFFRRGLHFLLRRIERVAQIELQRLKKMLRAKVQRLAKDRLVLVEFAAHAGILRTLPGKQEYNRGRSRRGYAGGNLFAHCLRQRADCFVLVLDDQRSAMRESVAAKLAGEGNVSQIQFGMRVQVIGEIGKGAVTRSLGLCRDRQQLPGLWISRLCQQRRCFFQHDVRIGAADAQRRHTCAPGRTVGRPIGELAVDKKRTVLQLDVRIQLLEMQTGGQLRMLQREHGLHQPGHAGCRIQVAYVGLQRADSAVSAACSSLSKSIREGSHFDRIADHGPGSVRLNIRNLLGVNARKLQSLGNHLGLAFNARRQIAHFARAIIIDGRS